MFELVIIRYQQDVKNSSNIEGHYSSRIKQTSCTEEGNHWRLLIEPEGKFMAETVKQIANTR